MGMFGKGRREPNALRKSAPNALKNIFDDAWRTYGGGVADALGDTADLINNPFNAAMDWAGVPYRQPAGAVQSAVPQPGNIFGDAARFGVGLAMPVPGAKAKAGTGLIGAGRRAAADVPDRVARGLQPDGSLDVAWITRDVRPGAANYGELKREQIRAMNQLRDGGSFVEVEVPISRLVATQKSVNPDFATHAAKRAAEGGAESLPAVYRVNGNLVLTDGHHRVAGAASNGSQTARVRLYDVDRWLQGEVPADPQLPFRR